MNLNRPYLTLKEIDILISKTPSPRDKLLLRWLSRSGIRITELLQLEVDRIDFSQHNVRITHQKQKTKLKCPRCNAWVGKTHNFCPKCSGELLGARSDEKEIVKKRTIPIDGETLRWTSIYLVGRKGGRIFEITRQRADQIIKEAGDRVGLESLLDLYTEKKTQFHAHVFRHSFAMHWIKIHGQEAMSELQLHLGHADIKTTMKYLHWSPQEIHKPYDKLWG